MTKIAIVDDEPASSNMLRILIERHVPDPCEVMVCHGALHALDAIPVFGPHLLMLDIEMPYLNGFDLLNRLGNREFDVIFTTAFDHYAIKAIRFSALDYLLKPIDITELQQAVHRHIVRRESKAVAKDLLVDNLMENLQQRDSSSFKLALNTTEGYYFFAPKTILRCMGDDNYTRFYFVDGKELMVSRTLKEFEELLADHHFVRVHKSHLVNMDYAVRFDREHNLWLANGTSVPVSRRKKPFVFKLMPIK